MQTPSVQVWRQPGLCLVGVHGAVGVQLIAQLRGLTAGAARLRIDLRAATVPADVLEELRRWHRAEPERWELLLPDADAAAPQAPVDLPDLLAHEVRGPLTLANLRLQTLIAGLRAAGRTEEADHCQAAMGHLDAVDRLLEIYLTASRPWRSNPLELTALCREAASAARDLHPDGAVAVRRRPRTGELWVLGEPQALQQLALNLIRNGLEATGAMGRVRIALRAAEDGRRVLLQVLDDGPGFPPEVLREPFARRSSAKPGGMGIGLILVRWIAERHGGALSLANGPRGAVATVELPRCPAPADPA